MKASFLSVPIKPLSSCLDPLATLSFLGSINDEHLLPQVYVGLKKKKKESLCRPVWNPNP